MLHSSSSAATVSTLTCGGEDVLSEISLFYQKLAILLQMFARCCLNRFSPKEKNVQKVLGFMTADKNTICTSRHVFVSTLEVNYIIIAL